MKALQCSQPIFKICDPGLAIDINTDSSIKGVGVEVKQKDQRGNSKSLACFSKKTEWNTK